MLTLVTPGLQTTLQGAPRRGWRHFGIPYAGPADALSMALANRLVENDRDATALEISLSGFEAVFERDGAFAVTGATGSIRLSDEPVPSHQTLHAKAGDTLALLPPRVGARTYLAVRSGFRADAQFGSTSTYLPAGFGGQGGRALKAGDQLTVCGDPLMQATLETPPSLRPVLTSGFALRACAGAEADLLDRGSAAALFGATFTAGRQATRMGLSLEGRPMVLRGDGLMKSAPVFPGTIQCPQDGVPIVLLSDAQTTGGYPRIASITRADRHLLGQVRPGNTIMLLRRTLDDAVQDFHDKQALFQDWLT